MISAIVSILLILGGIYLWILRRIGYWNNRGVLSDTTSFFFFGRKQHFACFFEDLYKRYKEHGYVGVFIGGTPTILLCDLDLVKRMFVTDFECFTDRGFYYNEHDDPLSNNILRLRGEAWRTIRTKMTPTFTSGKIKNMFPSVLNVGKRLVAKVQEDLVGLSGQDLEIRDFCARYTTDVIGSVAFGIECNSLKNPNTDFRRKGDRAFTSFKPWLDIISLNHEYLLNKLGVRVFPKELIEFYTRIVQRNMMQRQKLTETPNDFFNLLMEMHAKDKEDEDALTSSEVIGQAFVFFIAGFETSSSTMSFCLYELAKNPDVQKKARQDINDALERHNNEFSYESLQDMKYLERCVMETLRKHPVAPNIKRVSRKPWRIPNTKHTLEPLGYALVSVYGIHHDPAYYPDPQKFEPDRFLPQEMAKRHPMTYLPFGAGPRACIAARFAKIQTSLGVAMLLKHFEFSASEATPKVLKYDLRNNRNLSPAGGIRLRVGEINTDLAVVRRSDPIKLI